MLRKYTLRGLLLQSALALFWCETSACTGPAGTGDGAVGDATSGDGGPACRSDRECSTRGLVCDRVRGVCVECLSRADCVGANLECQRNRCVPVVPCTTSRMCPGQVCGTTQGYCVDCNVDVDCPTDLRCSDGSCIPRPRPCMSSRQCSEFGLVCNLNLQICVECVGDEDCDSTQYCRTDGLCRRKECVPGEMRCDGPSILRTCDARGTALVGRPCPSGTSCDSGRCRMQVCVPGTSVCDGTRARRVCAVDGLQYTTSNCEPTETCVEGQCRVQ